MVWMNGWMGRWVNKSGVQQDDDYERASSLRAKSGACIFVFLFP